MVTDLDPVQNAYWIANNYEAKRYEYSLSPSDIVIDLGAYIGEFAMMIHLKYGCKVICVEPTSSANHLESNQWCTVINKAVSDSVGRQAFGGNSYYTSAVIKGDQYYETFDILSLFMFEDIALMKVNIEGLEYSVMKRILESGLVHKVKYFQIQFHNINEQSEYLRKCIQLELCKTHRQSWNVDFVWESWERIC